MLVLVVGPSGAGKDTLIGGAREALAGDGRFEFPRRIVTRDAMAELEDHDSLDRDGFERALERGRFALHWDAHGLRYGLPASIGTSLAAGKVVVANVSRRAIGAARAKYPDCVVLLVTADFAIRAGRLAARGRESAPEIAARLAREGAAVPEDVTPVVIDNSGPQEAGVGRFVAALRDAAGAIQNLPQ